MNHPNSPMSSPDTLAEELQEARDLRLYLRAVGDLVRLHVLRQLVRNNEMSVTELARLVRVSQPLLSWHLGVLRRIGLVVLRRDGRMAWYSLNREQFDAYQSRVRNWLGDGQRGEDAQ